MTVLYERGFHVHVSIAVWHLINGLKVFELLYRACLVTSSHLPNISCVTNLGTVLKSLGATKLSTCTGHIPDGQKPKAA